MIFLCCSDGFLNLVTAFDMQMSATSLEDQLKVILTHQNLIIGRTDHSSANNLISMASTSPSAEDEIKPLTGHPYFTWILSPTNISGGFHMRVPWKIAKLLPSAEAPAVLHCRGKRWEMKYYGNRQGHMFDYRWKYFILDNCLKVGDALIFELIGSKKVEFKMQILEGRIPSVALPCNEEGSSATPIVID